MYVSIVSIITEVALVVVPIVMIGLMNVPLRNRVIVLFFFSSRALYVAQPEK